MQQRTLLLFSSACVLGGTALLLTGQSRELPVVPEVDVKRYAGKWFEVARLPNRFQRQCVADVTATYTERPDGKIDVLNTCREAQGKLSTIKGTARPAEKDGSPAKLKVTFFWPFAGDYWIIGLDPAYQWAMVGTPDRKFLWILSREPQLPAATYDTLLTKAKELGFDITRVQKTQQHA